MKCIKQYLLLCFLLLSIGVSAQGVITDWQSYHQVTRFNDWYVGDDAVYVSTDAGVFLLDKDDFELIDHWTMTSNGLPSNQVEAIAVNPITGTKYIGTYDIGMALQAEDGSWQTMPYPDDLAQLTNLRTYCINFDAQNRLLVGTSEGLLRWEGSEWTLLNLLEQGSPLKGVWSMQKLENGEVVLGGATVAQTAGDELFVFPPVAGESGFPTFESYVDVKVHVSSNGDIFSVTHEGEMGMMSAEGDWQQWSTLNEATTTTFFGSTYIYEDNNGTIWVGLGNNSAARYVDGEWEQVAQGPLELPQELAYFRQDTDGYTIAGSTSTVYLIEDETVQYPTPFSRTSRWSNPTDFLGSVATYPGSETRKPILATDQQGEVWGLQGHTFDNSLVSLATGNTWTLESSFLGINDFAFDRNNDLWIIDFDQLHQVSDWEVSSSYNLPAGSGNFTDVDADGDNNIWVASSTNLFAYTDGSFQEVALPLGNMFIVKMIANSSSAEAYVQAVDSETGDQHLMVCSTGDGYDACGILVLPQDLKPSDHYNFHYDANSETLWFTTEDGQLVSRSTDGTLEFVEFPQDWDSEGVVRRIGSYEVGLWLMGDHQVAFYQNEEWFVYNSVNAPIDTERLIDLALDGDQVFWMVHSDFRMTEAAQVEFSVSTDLPELVDIQPGKVFPNPASNFINLDWADRGTAYIVDVNGRVVREIPTSNSTTTISVADLTPGSYWLLWDGDSERRLAPFIKL